jgi:hypothetical protein
MFMVKANPNKNQNTCMFTVKEKPKKYFIIICTNQQDFELDFYPFCPFREMI